MTSMEILRELKTNPRKELIQHLRVLPEHIRNQILASAIEHHCQKK